MKLVLELQWATFLKNQQMIKQRLTIQSRGHVGWANRLACEIPLEIRDPPVFHLLLEGPKSEDLPSHLPLKMKAHLGVSENG